MSRPWKLSLLLSVLYCLTANAELVITGLVDGPLSGGTPKSIELYARTAIPDLGMYAIGSANNGGGTDGPEFVLSGAAAAGEFLYITSEATEAEFQSFFGVSPTFLGAGAANNNGDDAVELFFDGSGLFDGGETVIDVFGAIDTDGTDQPWEYTDGWAYRASNTGPDGSMFALANWSFSGINALDGEASNATAAVPFPRGTYAVPEPGSGLLTLLSAAMLVNPLRRRSRRAANRRST
jgi:hypothetical protein